VLPQQEAATLGGGPGNVGFGVQSQHVKEEEERLHAKQAQMARHSGTAGLVGGSVK